MGSVDSYSSFYTLLTGRVLIVMLVKTEKCHVTDLSHVIKDSETCSVLIELNKTRGNIVK